MNSFYSIAIDGPSGAGKSSLSKKIAAEFGFIYVDTGAIYRTVGLAAHSRNINCKDEPKIAELLPELTIDIAYDETGLQKMLLDGEDVSKEIRMPEISICASDVSSLPTVRAYLLEMQRKFARMNNVIMDGRDIGTVVLPEASLKIYLTASAEARAERRYKELVEKGVDTIFEDVLKDIKYRDDQDMTRSVAPLKPASDAIIVDTSDCGFDESLNRLSTLIEEKLHIKRAD